MRQCRCPRSTERPLRRDAERNRQRILAAAAEVFAERGLAATLDDVAREAGVGVGTVYRRFPDKEELIDALFEQRIDEMVARAEASVADDDPWTALVRFFERFVERSATTAACMELLVSRQHGQARVTQARDRLSRSSMRSSSARRRRARCARTSSRATSRSST